MREKPLAKSPLFWGLLHLGSSAGLLSRLARDGLPAIGLPVQWIWLSVIPILLALVVGGYIGKFKAPGLEFEPGIRNLPYYPPTPSEDRQRSITEDSRAHVTEDTGVDLASRSISAVEELRQEREEEIARTHLYFLLHVCKPSTTPGQRYDVRIFVIRHVQGPEPNQKEGFTDIDKAEFYFGRSWGNRIFTAKNDGGHWREHLRLGNLLSDVSPHV